MLLDALIFVGWLYVLWLWRPWQFHRRRAHTKEG